MPVLLSLQNWLPALKTKILEQIQIYDTHHTESRSSSPTLSVVFKRSHWDKSKLSCRQNGVMTFG